MVSAAVRPIRGAIRALVRRFGFDVVRHLPHSHTGVFREQLLSSEEITLVLDVGANVGQYVDDVRSEGYSGRIVSFEPTQDLFASLEARAARDPRWEAHRLALAEGSGTVLLHRFAEPVYNSLLPGVIGSVPAETGTEHVTQRTLDSLEGKVWSTVDRIWLKLDTQGSEASVLRGATRALAHCRVVEIEVSMTPLYEGQDLFYALAETLYAAGLRMVAMRPVLVQANSFVDQADAFFVRR